MTTKHIILCADDYAQNEAVCAGILILLEKQRINAVSCLVNSANWPEAQFALRPHQNKHAIGLHLNFTMGKPLSSLWQKQHGNSFTNLPRLLQQAYCRQLSKSAILAEINAQVDAFTNALGQQPDFIDGHQHVHQLPMIRDGLLECYQQQHWTGFLRSTSNGFRDLFAINEAPKRQLISVLGGFYFKNRLKKAHISTNTSFAGIDNFNHRAPYQQRFQSFLKSIKPGGLIMCHPGLVSIDTSDPLYLSRHQEFEYFNSEALMKDLQHFDVTLSRP